MKHMRQKVKPPYGEAVETGCDDRYRELMGLRCYPLAHQAAPNLFPHTDQQPGSALLATHIHLLPSSFLIFILSTLLCFNVLSSICFKAVRHRKICFFAQHCYGETRNIPEQPLCAVFPETRLFSHERVEPNDEWAHSILSLYVNTDSPHHLEIRKSSRLKHTIFANCMNILNHSLNRPILWNANKNKSILLHNEDMFFLHVHQPPAAPHSERMLDASPKKVLCSSPAGRMTTPPKGEVMHLPGMRLVDHNKQ